LTEKGGPVFRPVVKSRSRPAVGDIRQPSLVPAGSDNTLTNSPSTSVPLLEGPSRTPNVPQVQGTSSPPHPLQVVNSNVGASSSVSGHPSSFATNYQPAIPSLASNMPTQLRGAHPLPLHQTVSADTRASPSQSTSPLSSAVITLPSRPLDQSIGSNSRMGLLPPQGYALYTGTENIAIQPPRSTPVNNHSTNSPPEEQTGDSNISKKTRRQKPSQEASAEPHRHSKRKRTTAAGSDAEGSNEQTATLANRPKRRAPSGTPRARKSRLPSLPPFDADADPGEEIDPTVVTMASLCDDTGQGRVSRKAVEILTNHAAWKAQNREKRARMKTLMEQKKYGRDEADNEGDANHGPSNSGEVGSTGLFPPNPSNPAADTAPSEDTGGGFDYSQDLATSRFNVQVRIGPNGETIIDEESLVVDRVEAEDTEDYTHVVESDNTKFVNSGSYGKRFRGSRWSLEETESFYEVSGFLRKWDILMS